MERWGDAIRLRGKRIGGKKWRPASDACTVVIAGEFYARTHALDPVCACA